MIENMGRQIRAARLRSNLTQEKLAETLGVTAQAVSKWENGVGYPDIALLPELSAALGVTLDELFETTMQTHLRRIERMMENEPVLSREDFDYAERCLKEGCLDTATRGECLSLLAQLHNHVASHHHSMAEDYAKQALAVDPEKKSNHSALNIASEGWVPDWCCMNHREMIDYYKDFVRAHADYAPGYLWLMDNLIPDGRLDEAREALEQMARVRNDYRVLMYRGLIEKQGGDHAAAWRCWNEMVESDPENWFTWSCRGDCYAREARYDEAIADFRRAAELNTTQRYTDNYDSIAQLCLLKGDRAGAAEAFEKVVEILREDWDVQEGETITGYLKNIEELRR